MNRKLTMLLGLMFVLSTNVGCCRMADRWCHNNQQPAPQCCPAPAPVAYAPVQYAPQAYAPAMCPPMQRPVCQ